MRIAVLIALAACSSAPQAPPTPAGAPASLQAQPASGDDVIVAQVNGRPVWGSCVTTQSARGQKSRDVALHECIDFELMAQAAEKRGLAIDPDVVDATRTSLVNEMIAKAYEDTFTKPSDFGGHWDKIAEHERFMFEHPAYRASTYVRVPITPNAPPDLEAAAHAIANKIAAATANEAGLLSDHFVEIARRAVPDHPIVLTSSESKPPGAIEYANTEAMLPEGYNKVYAEVLWTIPEVGRTSQPVRTNWGWDVILWSSEVAALAPPATDELTEKLLPVARRSYFTAWVNRITRELGVHVQLFKENVALLEREIR